jgi:hypothetical protein
VAYGEAAQALRRCTGLTYLGEPCPLYAVWRAVPLGYQLCTGHLRQRGIIISGGPGADRSDRRACACDAYAWPHRPGGGRCQWPNAPHGSHPTPAGVHSPLWEHPNSAAGTLIRALRASGRYEGGPHWIGHPGNGGDVAPTSDALVFVGYQRAAFDAKRATWDAGRPRRLALLRLRVAAYRERQRARRAAGQSRSRATEERSAPEQVTPLSVEGGAGIGQAGNWC